VRPAHGGTESAGKNRIPERLLGFRKTPAREPFALYDIRRTARLEARY